MRDERALRLCRTSLRHWGRQSVARERNLQFDRTRPMLTSEAELLESLRDCNGIG